jgi:hypothetical protein
VTTESPGRTRCGGRVLVEARGPPGVSRTIRFARGEKGEGLDVAQLVVVEGELVVIRHPARGEFRAVVEIQRLTADGTVLTVMPWMAQVWAGKPVPGPEECGQARVSLDHLGGAPDLHPPAVREVPQEEEYLRVLGQVAEGNVLAVAAEVDEASVCSSITLRKPRGPSTARLRSDSGTAS